ncbi:hypothetical protein ACKWTF_016297 [Chironomus riparius]
MKSLKISWIILLVLICSFDFTITQESEDPVTVDETTEEASTTETSVVEVSSTTAENNESTTVESTTDDQKSSKSSKREKPEEACKPWPSTYKPLRECCMIPHNPLQITLNTCFYRCTSRETDERRQIECGASCFINVTGIFYDHRLNRERIKNLMIGASVVPSKWIRIIEAGIDSCKFEDNGSMHDRLARFFGCLTDFMTDNCVQFVQTPDCERSQELFEQCHHIKPICEHWPFGYGTLDSCCKIPPLFSQALRSKCHHECTYSELFLQRQAKCDEFCRYDDTKLRVGNAFNFDAVKAMLMESVKGTPEWKVPIDHAVEKCKIAMGSQTRASQTRQNTIEYEITTLQTCLREFLANDCVDFKEEPICHKVQFFMKNCPEVKPRKSTTHYSQHYP